MKARYYFSILMAAFLGYACSDDALTDMGSSIQPVGDKIDVYADTFHLASDDYFVPFMYSKPDSFLLGTFYDTKYGTVVGDILAQVEHPQGHEYPAGTVFDSVRLVMYYDSWFGDNYSPMQINVYEMNKSTFNYTEKYKTNLNPADYTDKSELIGKKSITAVDATGTMEDNAVVIKLSNSFLQRFTNINADTYSSESKFQDFFGGVYINTAFGSATMLTINQLSIDLHYHYTYTVKGSNNQDSTVIVKQTVPFPANKWVRQVNRIQHPDSAQIKANLQLPANQGIHYISTPANIYTRVKLPVKRIAQSMDTNGKMLNINSGTLRVDVLDVDESDLAQPYIGMILLVRESSMNRFFSKDELPSDTVAVLGTIAYETNDETDEVNYYYQFELSALLSAEIKAAKENGTALPDFESFMLVPVLVGSDSNGTTTSVVEEYTMSAMTLCGASHPTRPMRFSVVYSGF